MGQPHHFMTTKGCPTGQHPPQNTTAHGITPTPTLWPSCSLHKATNHLLYWIRTAKATVPERAKKCGNTASPWSDMPVLSHNPTMAVTPGIPPAGNHCSQVQQTRRSRAHESSKRGGAAATCPARRRSRHHVYEHVSCYCVHRLGSGQSAFMPVLGQGGYCTCVNTRLKGKTCRLTTAVVVVQGVHGTKAGRDRLWGSGCCMRRTECKQNIARNRDRRIATLWWWWVCAQ